MACSWDTQSSSSQLPPSLPGRLGQLYGWHQRCRGLFLLPVSAASYAFWKAMTFDIRQTKRSWLSSSVLLWLGNLRAFIESNRWGGVIEGRLPGLVLALLSPSSVTLGNWLNLSVVYGNHQWHRSLQGCLQVLTGLNGLLNRQFLEWQCLVSGEFQIRGGGILFLLIVNGGKLYLLIKCGD